MKGSVSEEIEVKVPSSEAWKVYGTLKLVDIIESIPASSPKSTSKATVASEPSSTSFLIQVRAVEGMSYKEKFIVVDNEKRLKVAEVVEGGYLNLGFISYRVRLEVIDKGERVLHHQYNYRV